ncbi:hypothetical protein DSL72_009246 [Monilinia vaccinii-corymbosi]|uniref:RRM domain-containing protein n=1 Tax=Monilinia vaccinii-corymbosi TaxID=61207 RepID=A0A8A3PNU4_9HELO|nr:hypothetical protein DSL72_009246 [Monilinia vaccinii-corymbosi]
MPSRTPSPVPRGRSRARSRSRIPYSSASRYTRSRSRSPRRSISPRSRSRSGGRSRSRSRSRGSAAGTARNGGARYRSESRGRSLSPRGRSRSRSRTRERSESAGAGAGAGGRSTKVVIEKLTKNVTEDHLREIFGTYGEIKDLDVPMNRSFNTNRGTAYILYVSAASAESAIAHMHESQLDGAIINVSIVLPRRKFSPQPPMARRGVNIDPRIPLGGGRSSRGGFDSRGGAGGGMGGGRMMDRERERGGDTYRPGERDRERSRSPRRHRTRSRSLSSRSRSRSPPRRGDRGRDRRDSFGGRGGVEVEVGAEVEGAVEEEDAKNNIKRKMHQLQQLGVPAPT